MVVKEKQDEVGGSTYYKKAYSLETTTLENLEADEEPKDEKIPVCWTRGGGGPLRRQRHEVSQSQTYSWETTTSEKLVAEDTPHAFQPAFTVVLNATF